VDEDRAAGPRGAWIGDVHPGSTTIGAGLATGNGSALPTPAAGVAAIEPREQAPPPNVVTIPPGTTMAEVERSVIEAALKETRGNRRKAAEMLGIGERTLYRKLREYQIPDAAMVLD